ncbi:MAG TPA: hypothetical protein VGR31_15285 [Planctomycetota bacterium]|jgi:hypothetical protein|nr:hypothetical protein [Planctomycetota bacterium]
MSPENARAIDRLARGAHAFHRYAHHPLCAEYAGETIALGGRVRICRGCTLAAAGALAGALAGTWIAPTLFSAALALALGAACAHRGARGLGKFVARGLSAGLLAFGTAGGFRDASLAGAAVGVLGLVSIASWIVSYRRRGPDRSACAACPERTAPVPCRGVASIVRRERAFQRLAGRMIGP